MFTLPVLPTSATAKVAALTRRVDSSSSDRSVGLPRQVLGRIHFRSGLAQLAVLAKTVPQHSAG